MAGKERVFRICKYTKLKNTKWKLKKKVLYDSEKGYKAGIRVHTRDCKGRQGPMVLLQMCFTGEEFINGEWIPLMRYPEEEGD